ncbi:AraC family transcriptional regulator [Yoonia sp. GPGPB17]|uniref:AraC family transcriptional regulator n=1 Tax=Yoonia sp. GPGPB17 TaxID=3026147 RepID=UPI0040409284
MRLHRRNREPLYHRALKLEVAALALARNPKTNVLQLALECGFQTHSAFSKAFRKQFGVSPSDFRANPDVAQKGVDQDRPFLVSAPAGKMIAPVDIVTLKPFHFQFRKSSGTLGGQFFRKNDGDVGQQFALLRAVETPPNLYVMSCFPNAPQALNDDTVPVWFGGAFSARTENDWSKDWHMFAGGTWAVFQHWGNYSFLYQTWNQIYRNWVPQTDFLLRDDIPFEAYLGPSGGADKAGPLTQIYIPVKKA